MRRKRRAGLIILLSIAQIMLSKMISSAVLSHDLRQVYLSCQELFAEDQRQPLHDEQEARSSQVSAKNSKN